MFVLNMCHDTQSTPKQNEIIALLSLLLILNKWHLALVFLLLNLNMYLFSGFDSIQVPFIYRKDFLEVKYLHEVAYTGPCLLFFFQIF